MTLGTKESQGIILIGSWLVVLENVARLAKYVSVAPSSVWCPLLAVFGCSQSLMHYTPLARLFPK